MYKLSQDGPTSEEFHRKCDNKGATVSFFELENGMKLAGYTSKNWQ